MKAIVLFSDGTGNGAAALFKTNVWRLYQAVDLSAGSGQIAYYDDGVGSSSFRPLALLGGAFGFGLKRNVLDLYIFLSRQYHDNETAGENGEPPRIFAFGFSRGAFTIRVLTGLVKSQGLLQPTSEAKMRARARRAYRAYRAERFHTDLGLERPFRWLRDAVVALWDKRPNGMPYDGTLNTPNVRFAFLGLWDTVDAYGMPIDEVTTAMGRYVFPMRFTDNKLSSVVDVARHALSIDDERITFWPVLWESDPRVQQVWFAGVHANVGGGYPDDGMAFASLAWIMREAGAARLAYRPGSMAEITAAVTPYGRTHDPRGGFGTLYRYGPRRDLHDSVGGPPTVHETVIQRMAAGVDGYAPVALPATVNVMGASGLTLAGVGLKPPLPDQVAHAWATVWLRRVAYYGTLLPVLGLLALPLVSSPPVSGSDASDNKFEEVTRSLVAQVFQFADALTPGYLMPWIQAFKREAPVALTLAIVAAAAFLWSLHLRTRIADRVRAGWGIGSPPTAAVRRWGPFVSLAHWLSGSRFLADAWTGLSQRVVPGLIALALALGAVVVVDRLVFRARASLGEHCKPAAQPLGAPGAGSPDKSAVGPRDVPDDWTAPFDLVSKEPCRSTGYRMREGEVYRIEIGLPTDGSWTDATLPADLLGVDLKDASMATRITMAAFVPFRRVISAPWFAPVARIGDLGYDQYVLAPVRPFRSRAEARRMESVVTARTSGELFLFVNDAYTGLLPLGSFVRVENPKPSPWHTYGNNAGVATVRIKRVDSAP